MMIISNDPSSSSPTPAKPQNSTILTRLQSPERVLVAGLVLGWLFDLLFFDKMLGVSAFLFVLALLAILGILTVYEGVRPHWSNFLLFPAILFFAAMVFMRANEFLTFLNVCLVIALLMVLASKYAAANLFHIRFRDGILIPFFVANYAMWYGGQTVKYGLQQLGDNPKKMRSLTPILRGILLATPILFVFTILLASSDMIFADYLKRFFDWKTIDDLVEYGWRGLLILGVGWAMTGAFVYSLVGESEERQVNENQDAFPVGLGFGETTTVLSLVNALFIFFGWVQLAYLFGGRANITIEGFTYAEYARRGFFELVTVAVLTFGLVLGLHWFSRRETKRQTRLFNGLSSVMAGLVLILLASAFLRLQLYELAYGFTELRLYSHLFMVWLGLIFVGMVLLLWLGPQRIAIMVAVGAMGFVATLNFINPDAFIVQQNLARYHRSGDLDVRYLITLSNDAVPMLLVTLEAVAENRQSESLLYRNLVERWHEYQGSNEWRRWQSAHISRWRAYQALSKQGYPEPTDD